MMNNILKFTTNRQNSKIVKKNFASLYLRDIFLFSENPPPRFLTKKIKLKARRFIFVLSFSITPFAIFYRPKNIFQTD